MTTDNTSIGLKLLTDEQIRTLWESRPDLDRVDRIVPFARAVERVALARRSSPAGAGADERALFDKWAGIEYRHASHYTALEHDIGWAAWQARAAQAQPANHAQGEPVAYVNGDELDNMLDDRTATIQTNPSGWRRTALYRAPVSALPAGSGGADYTVDDSELARKIMVFMGRATTSSLEPGADPLRDRLAERLALWRPAAIAQPSAGAQGDERAAVDEIPLPAGAFLRREARTTGANGWLLYGRSRNLIRALNLAEVELVDAALAAAPAAPAAPQGDADEIEQRTEKIRLLHANQTDRSKTHLIRDVAHLLEHITLLRSAAPAALHQQDGAQCESHPYERDLAGLNEFIDVYCNGDWRLISCAEAAWYRCMERNHPANAAPAVQQAGAQPVADEVAAKPSYDPNRLLDTLLSKTQLRNDAALARMLEVSPGILAKVRHHRLQVGASLLTRMHEVTGMSIRDLRDLMGDRRAKYRLAGAPVWTDEQRRASLSAPVIAGDKGGDRG